MATNLSDLLLGGSIQLRQRGASAELDLAAVIDPENLHIDFIAQLQHIFYFVDAAVGDFADVQQAILLRQNFDERAEFLDADDPAR